MAAVLRRGEVVWADLNPVRGREQAGHRPVLIISEDIFNRRSGTVIAMALTSHPQKAGFPLALRLSGRETTKGSVAEDEPGADAFDPKARTANRKGGRQ